jgi:hypothetical protein
MTRCQRRNIACAAILLLARCGGKPAATRASYESLAVLQGRFGSLVTTGNHPTPDQYGTGDRVGFFRDADGTVWGLPLSIGREGAVVGCAPVALRGAAVTDEFPASATIVGSTNAPTGWRGGTGGLELVLRTASGDIAVQEIHGGRLPDGPICWASDPPGPTQQLSYYRLTPTRRAK